MKRRHAFSPLLSLCMIVRNEEENLPACLDNIKSVVDEIIVVDTGSTDRTVEIAKSFGAKVYHFKWIDDFSAARNESIKHATGDYILWLDADDRISRKGRQGLKRLREKLRLHKNLAYALLIVCKNRYGEAVVNYQPRVFPNVEGARFEGRVHEEIVPSLGRLGIKIVKEDVEIIHAGYKDGKTTMAKVERNLRILLNSNPGKERRPIEYYRLAQSYFGIKDYARCLQCLDKAMGAGKKASFYKYAYTMVADCYLQLGQGEVAVKRLQKALIEFPDSGYLHYLLGVTFVLLGRYEEAISYLEKAAGLNIEIEGGPVPLNINSRLLYYYGKSLEGVGRLETAEDAYEKALKGAPDDLDVLQALGFLMSKLGRLADALVFFQRAKERSPRVEKRIWLALARICLFLNKNEEAFDLYSDILAKDPIDVDALVGMARVSMEMGNLEHLSFAFEELTKGLGMSTDVEVSSLADLARIAADVGKRMKQAGERENAAILEDIAFKLDPEGLPPHLAGH